MVFAFLTTLLLGPVIMAFEWPRTMGIETSYYFHHTHRHCHVVLLGEQNVTVPYKGYWAENIETRIYSCVLHNGARWINFPADSPVHPVTKYAVEDGNIPHKKVALSRRARSRRALFRSALFRSALSRRATSKHVPPYEDRCVVTRLKDIPKGRPALMLGQWVMEWEEYLAIPSDEEHVRTCVVKGDGDIKHSPFELYPQSLAEDGRAIVNDDYIERNDYPF